METPENYTTPSANQSTQSSRSDGNTSTSQLNQSNSKEQPIFQAPQIKLPKCGDAIQGIGEKFQINPVKGIEAKKYKVILYNMMYTSNLYKLKGN